MQMDANFQIIVFRHYRADQLADLLRSRHANSVRQRDHPQIVNLQQRDGMDHFFRIPKIAIPVSERHRDINHDLKTGIVGFLLDLFKFVKSR